MIGLRSVLAVLDLKKGSVLSVGADLDRLGHAKQFIDYWIKRFVSRVDKAHGEVDDE